ncbi:MAG: DUF3568 family protein [Phycisphaeraceae bacterium]|nr:DUF3568 family protein [Phycisphaeraceae bacterium]
MPRITSKQITRIIVIGLSTSTLMGCSSSNTGGSLFTIEGTSSLATGDWNDVNAAVQAAAQHREMIVETESQPNPKTLQFSLLTVRSEPVTVTVTRTSAPDPSARLSQEGPIAMNIEVKVGRFGDSRRERELIDDIRSRLGDLVGPFTTKPLPESWGGWGG